MRRWMVVLALVSAMLLSGITSVAAKSVKEEKSGYTETSGPIYPGGIFDLR